MCRLGRPFADRALLFHRVPRRLVWLRAKNMRIKRTMRTKSWGQWLCEKPQIAENQFACRAASPAAQPPGLKPGICTTDHSRRFKNPLPRTRGPGKARGCCCVAEKCEKSELSELSELILFSCAGLPILCRSGRLLLRNFDRPRLRRCPVVF